MASASVEAMLELWALSPRGVKGRVAALFTRERAAAVFLDGLLGPGRRRTGATQDRGDARRGGG